MSATERMLRPPRWPGNRGIGECICLVAIEGELGVTAGELIDARMRLQRAIDQQRVRAQIIQRLFVAFDEQQVQLGEELALALHAFGAADRQASASQTGASVVVRCLGAFGVSIGGTSVKGWRSGKARALMQFLITRRGRPVSREALIRALWPDPDALAASTSLKVAVYTLRQILSEVTSGFGAPSLSVVVRESNYELKAADAWVDVEEFERCCHLGARLEADGRTQEALAVFERAAELYLGDFLEDSLDDWVVLRREGLKDQYLVILAHLADAAIKVGDYQRCIHYSRRLLEVDNCREDTYRMLMICHARLGQPSRVRRWHEVCVQTIRAMLEVDPDPETERVFKCAVEAPDRHGAGGGLTGW